MMRMIIDFLLLLSSDFWPPEDLVFPLNGFLFLSSSSLVHGIRLLNSRSGHYTLIGPSPWCGVTFVDRVTSRMSFAWPSCLGNSGNHRITRVPLIWSTLDGARLPRFLLRTFIMRQRQRQCTPIALFTFIGNRNKIVIKWLRWMKDQLHIDEPEKIFSPINLIHSNEGTPTRKKEGRKELRVLTATSSWRGTGKKSHDRPAKPGDQQHMSTIRSPFHYNGAVCGNQRRTTTNARRSWGLIPPLSASV